MTNHHENQARFGGGRGSMTYATTFSGIGGWELGLDQCGWELKWQCEREPWCQALLRERFGVPIYGDITTLCENNPEPVDVLIGSPPCQPFSVAGSQRGTSDERHLYPSFLRAVGFLKPRWVLMEQVPAILNLDGGRAFGQYVGGLAALGYDLVWHCIPACAVGAPHRRDRLWIIAHARHDARCAEWECERQASSCQQARSVRKFGIGVEQCGQALANPYGAQRQGDQRQVGGESEYSDISKPSGSEEIVSDPFRTRQPRSWASWFGSDPAEAIEGEADPAQSERLNRIWGIESLVGRVAHGISHRVDRLKGLGNAVVPAIPQIIGRAINEVDSTNQTLETER